MVKEHAHVSQCESDVRVWERRMNVLRRFRSAGCQMSSQRFFETDANTRSSEPQLF